MSRRKARRPRHVPKRTCVGCREVKAKRELVRVVRSEEGVRIDPTGKAPGRGAYIHADQACWHSALRGSLAKALRVEISSRDRQALEAYAQALSSGEDD